jgi:hypothetical protein
MKYKFGSKMIHLLVEIFTVIFSPAPVPLVTIIQRIDKGRRNGGNITR